MKPLFVGLIVSLGWQTAFAGKITLQGISNLRHPVEFVSMRVDIRSRCQASPIEAAQKADLAKAQIKSVIQTHLDQVGSDRDQLVESGSSTGLQDEYDRESGILCKQAWTTSHSVILKTLQLKAVQEVCPMTDVKISAIQKSGPVIRDYADGDVSAGDLNFDQQYVHQAWNVTWSFKNTTGTCQ